MDICKNTRFHKKYGGFAQREVCDRCGSLDGCPEVVMLNGAPFPANSPKIWGKIHLRRIFFPITLSPEKK